MTMNTGRMLKFKPVIKKAIVGNHSFLDVAAFSRINSFVYIHSFVINRL